MSNARPIRCNQTNRIGTAEIINYCLDLSDLLQAAEEVEAITSVTADNEGVTIDDEEVLAADTVIDGREILAAKAITFTVEASAVTPPADGTAVELTAIVTTDGSNTRAVVMPLLVQD